MKHGLPDLPYGYDALEPYIDARTMEIHHTKHHAAYVSNLNAALESHPQLSGRPLEDILRNLENVPESVQTAFRNHGGGHINHSLFWNIMGPDCGGEPKSELSKAVNESFGDFATFKAQFEKAATTRFGSGWAWLCRNAEGGLIVTSTPNQDSPFMEGLTPILCLDVWEHAYYLKYQNRRAEYVSNWWNVVNWAEVERLYESAKEEITAAKR